MNALLFIGITVLLFVTDLIFTYSYFDRAATNPAPYYLMGISLMAFPALFVVNFLTNHFFKVGCSNRAILISSAVIPLISLLLVMIF